MASRYAPGMTQSLVHPPKAQPGDRIAVVSPSFAAPGFAPAVHEQAMRRLAEVTGLEPVEYPTTRQLGASPESRARDLNAAFADPQIRAVIATVGGEDQITVIGHLDAEGLRTDPKPFLGYSDNTNLHQWLWGHGVASFYGGSTQVHLGPGPAHEGERDGGPEHRQHDGQRGQVGQGDGTDAHARSPPSGRRPRDAAPDPVGAWGAGVACCTWGRASVACS